MIHLKSFLALIAISAVPFAAAAVTDGAPAPDTSPRSGGFHRSTGRAPVAVFVALDLDRNGVLSAAEIAHAPILLQALDTDGDGVLSTAELYRGNGARPVRTAAQTVAHPVRVNLASFAFNVAFTLDANRDGEIQTMEMANAVSSLEMLDSNGDGVLSPDELDPTSVSARTLI